MVPYKIDTGSNGNIMPLHVYKMLIPSITNKQLATTKNKKCPIKNIYQNYYNTVKDMYSNYRK